jgi:alpha-tubulin suppressor-like RCC1 family protein
MTRLLLRLLGLALGALVLFNSPAHATVAGPEARVRWLGDLPAAARAGEAFVGRFEIAASGPGAVEGVAVEGAGWSMASLEGPARTFLMRGDRRAYTFRGVPSDPKSPLVVRFTFDGAPVEKVLRLDEESLERVRRPRRAEFRGGAPRVETRREREGGGSIRFMGRFTYLRGDAAPMPEVGADSIKVTIWDDDSPDPFDEIIWEGYTDQQGYFDVVVFWDDGPDDPDPYLVFTTADDHIDVHDSDLFQTTYSWSSEDQVVEDFTGSLLDFGTLSPDPSQRGAVHLYNSIVRARRYADVHGGMSPQIELEIEWPRDDTPPQPPRYSSDDRTIYITSGATWSEYTHVHEYAHYLEDMFSVLYPPEYSNPGGYCDSPSPGHCIWCKENNLVAWQEGWAEWFGMSLVTNWEGLYQVKAWSLTNDARNLETPQACCGLPSAPGTCLPNQLQPGFETEGYLAALLWDMEDVFNEPGSPGSCEADVMSVGPGPILQVIRSSVFDPLDFIIKFRQYYPEHDQDFWSTARFQDVSFGFSAPPPIVLTQPEECVIVRAGDSFQLHAQGNGAKLKYQWRLNGAELFDGPGLTGTQEPTLRFSSVPAHMSGTYSCRVSTCSESLSVISLPARVTVLPAIDDNPMVSWGGNSSGEAGDGTNVGPRPPGVRALSGVIAVDGGQTVVAGLKSDGTVWSWGYPGWGVELGNGYSFTLVTTPTQVAGLDSVVAIAMGASHTLTLAKDGRIRGWGYNGYGQLGDSSEAHRPVPTIAKEVEGCVKAIACGASHSLALMADGTVMAWGSNEYGALGRGTSGGWSLEPQPVPGLTGVVAISAAQWSNLALKGDGTLWAWGWNFSGALGAGIADVSSAGMSATPVQVVGLTGVRSMCMSYSNGYAVLNDGSCWSWGTNANRQLGDGHDLALTHRNVPGLMPDLVNPLSIEAGDGGFRLALMPDSTVRMWGYNDAHTLGAPTPNVVPIPTPVQGVAGATGIGAGWSTAFALGLTTDVVSVPDDGRPAALALRTSPNPSFARTDIAFDLPHAGRASIAIYDVAGRRVHTLVDEPREAGRHRVSWDGRESPGGARLAGVYFARLEFDGRVVTRRIVRMR